MSDVPNGAEDTLPIGHRVPEPAACSRCNVPSACSSWSRRTAAAMSLSELATASGLAPATLHRLARTLVDLGYLRQEPSRRYALGPRLVPARPRAPRRCSTRSRCPTSAHLVDEIGETANLAMLDGDQVAYVAQAPGRHAMRMFTEVGRRVLPHCTAVGKALLATASDDDVRALLARTGLPRHTPHTVTDPEELLAQLELVRSRGLRDGRGRAGGRRPVRGGGRPGLDCPAGHVRLGAGAPDERRAARARRARAPRGRQEPGLGTFLRLVSTCN